MSARQQERTLAAITRLKWITRERCTLFLRALALEAHSRVVMRTPVRTGRARGNWMLTIGQMSRASRPDFYDPNGTTSIAEGLAFVKSLKFGDKMWTTNNLPYIYPLELGHSQQAPHGMAAITVKEVQAIASHLVEQIKREQGGLGEQLPLGLS